MIDFDVRPELRSRERRETPKGVDFMYGETLTVRMNVPKFPGQQLGVAPFLSYVSIGHRTSSDVTDNPIPNHEIGAFVERSLKSLGVSR